MKSRYKILLIPIASIITAQYLLAARHRAHAHECERKVSRGDSYIGEICYLPYRDGTLFRLYDARSNDLIAERTYSDIYPKMVFGDDRVYYSMSAGTEAYVLLPPTWLDRLRAKLP